MALSGGVLSCTRHHSHRVLVVNSYVTDLYLSWSIEICERLKADPLVDVGFLDVSFASFDKQLLLRARFKRFFFRKSKVGEVRAKTYLPDDDRKNFVSYYLLNFYRLQSVMELLKIFPYLLRSEKVENLLSIPIGDNAALRSAHSTLAGKIGTVEYSPRRYSFQIFLYLLSFIVIEKIVKKIVSSNNYCQVIVGNGRLLNSAAALSGAVNISKLIIERGAMPGMLDTYNISAHSMSERREHVRLSWESVKEDFAQQIAVEYLETRKVRDPISGISWTSSQRSGVLPEIKVGKKVCVFYTSTELEFAVFFDNPNPEEFSNQSEALLALIETLDPQEWIIFVRRHPYSREMKSDPEGKNWSNFGQFSNVEFISPDSSVDSYALGAKADLIAHFNSSMGPELIYQGTCPVITLGDNSWETTNSQYLLRTKRALADFFSTKLEIRPRSDAYPWAYYSATFGEKFKVVEWRDFRAYIHNQHILSRKDKVNSGLS